MERNEAIRSLVNPRPIKTIKRGSIVYTYEEKTSSVQTGSVELITGDSIILRTPDGLKPYWKKELWDDEKALKSEIDARLHPVREATIASIKTVKDLIAFCITHDFQTEEHAADLRQALSVCCSKLLGFDPFEPEETNRKEVKEGTTS